MQLYIEGEPIRRGGAPALDHSQIGHGIKRRIHLDHLKILRVPTKPLMRADSLGIPMLNKTWIGPAGRPNNNFGAFRLDQTFPRHAENRNHESCGKQTAVASKRWKIGCGGGPATAGRGLQGFFNPVF